MHKAKAADGTLFFSTTESGEHLHFQRKPYAAVFYSMGLLEFSKAVINLPDDHEMKLKLDAVEIKENARDNDFCTGKFSFKHIKKVRSRTLLR